MKKSKLTENSSRIPDISEVQITQQFKEYIQQASQLNTESAKAQRFLILFKDVFGDVNAGFIEDYLHGVEKYISVKKKDIILRGRIDTLFGNLVIEFERDLRRNLEESKSQLEKYITYLSEQVSKFLSKDIPQKSIGNLRKLIKSELADKIKEIDEIVKGVLKELDHALMPSILDKAFKMNF
jgi:hypothetical protein